MPTTPPTSSEPRLVTTLKADIRRVVADVYKRGVAREVGSTLSDLETFYLTEDRREALRRMHPVARFMRRLGWLVKSLLMKLTPARRVMLALGLVLVALSNTQVAIHTAHFDVSTPGFGLWGVVILFLVLMLELKDKLAARHELEAGRAVQFALMPDESPAVPGWRLWLYTRPANDVGGDLVDHVPVDADHHGVALGDVAGKALPAALLMVKLQATLRALVPEFPRLDDLGSAVNRILCRDGLPNRFATLVYVVLTTNSGRIRVLNAGHMPPLLLHGQTIWELPPGAMALGILPDAAFVEQTVAVEPGDVLVVFSDGVVEAMNPSGEFFGDDRLRAALAETSGQSPAEIGKHVLAVLDAFVADAPPHDDVSLVIVERMGASS